MDLVAVLCRLYRCAHLSLCCTPDTMPCRCCLQTALLLLLRRLVSVRTC